MADLFEPIEIPDGIESGQEFSDRVDTELNNAVARDNMLAEDAALDRRMVTGPGRLSNSGAEVSVVSGAVRIANGFFYAGPGVDSDDDSFFEGLRLREIAEDGGFLELTGADTPPLNKAAGTFGYMSWYGDVVWFDAQQTTGEQIAALVGRWCLGKVVTNGSGTVSINNAFTQTIPNLSEMASSLAALDARVTLLEGGGGGEGGFSYAGSAPWLPEPSDSRQTSVVLLEKFAALEARLAAAEGGNTRPQQTRVDQVLSRIALLEQAIARLHRDEARRYESAHVVLADDGEVYGTGVGDDEDFVGDGIQPDAEGVFNP